MLSAFLDSPKADKHCPTNTRSTTLTDWTVIWPALFLLPPKGDGLENRSNVYLAFKILYLLVILAVYSAYVVFLKSSKFYFSSTLFGGTSFSGSPLC